MAKYSVNYTDSGDVYFTLWFSGCKFTTHAKKDCDGFLDLETPSLGEIVKLMFPDIPDAMYYDIDEILCSPETSGHDRILEYIDVLGDYEKTWRQETLPDEDGVGNDK